MLASLRLHLPPPLAEEIISFLKPQKPWLYRHQGMCGDWDTCMSYHRKDAIVKCAIGAAQGGCIELVKALLQKGADAGFVLSYAAKNGGWHYFQDVVQLISSLNPSRVTMRPTLLYHAARGGNVDIWTWCMQNQFENVKKAMSEMDQYDDEHIWHDLNVAHKTDPVLGALRSGHYLLARKIQAWYQKDHLETFFAGSQFMFQRFGAVCRGGHVKLVNRVLQDAKATKDILSTDGRARQLVIFGEHYTNHVGPHDVQFMCAACRSGNLHLVKSLMSFLQTNDLNSSPYRLTLLEEACRSGNVELVVHIHESLKIPTRTHKSLRNAIQTRKKDLLLWLLNQREQFRTGLFYSFEETCLVNTVRYGWTQGFALCVNNMDIQSLHISADTQYSLLSNAMRSGEQELVKKLLSSKMSILRPPPSRMDALFWYACEEEDTVIMDMLEPFVLKRDTPIWTTSLAYLDIALNHLLTYRRFKPSAYVSFITFVCREITQMQSMTDDDGEDESLITTRNVYDLQRQANFRENIHTFRQKVMDRVCTCPDDAANCLGLAHVRDCENCQSTHDHVVFCRTILPTLELKPL